MEKRKLLNIKNLNVTFKTQQGEIKPVENVSFSIDKGQTMAIVGESGSGKTVTSLAIMRLLDRSAIVNSEIMTLDNEEMSILNKEEMRLIRGFKISMIFQEPMTSLNPVYKIDRQIGEIFKIHYPHITKKEIYKKSIDILEKVGVPKPDERLKVYPHQLSGGLRQRVMIAIALASNPQVLIADEPTTALDVTIQAQIIDLLKALQKEFNMSILLITHDFGVVSEIADKVAVMYAGRIVEEGNCEDILTNPLHPYTEMLIMSIPGMKIKKGERLKSIPGTVPSPLNFPKGCRFYPRCPKAMDICRTCSPDVYINKDRKVSCFLRRYEYEQ